MTPSPETPPPQDSLARRHPRLGGLLIAAIGGAFVWYFTLGPLRDAEAGRTVHYGMRSLVMGPVFLFWGLVIAVAGARAQRWNESIRNGESRARQLLLLPLIGISLAIALGTYLWFKSQLEALGYHMR